MPQGIDVNVPNAARMYDYYLGGDNNFPADRETAEKVLRIAPWARVTALENRAFLRRVVEFLARDHGVCQFVDIGTGLPTEGNVHEIAHRVMPDARIVYVDNDQVVLGHNRALLARVANTTTVRADLRRPAEITGHPELNALIDWSKPVAVLLIAVLHFIPNENDPVGIIGQFRKMMAPGSYIAISHAHHQGDEEAVRHLISIYRSANVPLILRSSGEIESLFSGFELLEPGVVRVSKWHPANESYADEEVWAIGGVGSVTRRG